jgi:ribosomal protein S18 acetylase RimI-like enzyme
VINARKVENVEKAKLSAVMAKIFQNDPMFVHLISDPASREARTEQAFRLFLERIYLPHQECYTLGTILGGAMWLPPGKHKPSIWQQLMLLPSILPIVGLSGGLRAMHDLNQMEKMHPKGTPHWYLGFVGVSPSDQGTGIGSALLRPVLERCDAERIPAYVENSNERNHSFYMKNGFKVVTECDIHKGPHLWGMWRAPQS